MIFSLSLIYDEAAAVLDLKSHCNQVLVKQYSAQGESESMTASDNFTPITHWID